MAENLFSCLTPFFETYELKGYVINSDWSYVWITDVKYYILKVLLIIMLWNDFPYFGIWNDLVRG